MFRKNKITIDYSICGDGNKIDPRDCLKCMQACKPAVFLLHQTIGAKEKNPLDPQKWRITALWPSLCTKCMACVQICPENAVKVR
ncbi:MAG: 4Fe-4S binding protein [Actinobacteria bacterium]|nr:4Fe-4S binding protein [Actinomycetota bacterium]